MAELFLARASSMHGFEKMVVLKRILPQHAESEDFIRMFLAEARLAATLHHPNIVQVYDIGEDANTYFFTMEYVQGQDLRKLVRAARRQQRPIPLEHILHIVMGVAAGLNHAHEKTGMDGKPLGIVHRDVSPSNVLVTYEGDVKIVDFGIAKAATAQVATIAGTLKGKIPYMSPEQCRGESVDRRSDIFSIGTLLWELTTGKRLFAGDNEFAILNRVAKGDVPLPSSIRPDYPPELEAIVMRALQSEPGQRYEQAVDLQIDLEDFAREARLPVSSARMSRFMRELFADEIRKTQEELQSEEVLGEIGAAIPGSGPSQVPIVAASRISSPPEGLTEYTPSELRQHSEPTGGGLEDGSSGTDIVFDGIPKRFGAGAAVAVMGGLLAAVAAAGFAYKMYAGNEVAPQDEPPPKVEVITKEIELDPEPEFSEPKAEPEPSPEASVLEVDPVEPGEQPAKDEGLDEDPVVEPVADPPEPSDDENVEAKEDDSSSGDRRRSKPTHRGSSRPKPKPKSKVDLDAPLPPGL